MATDTDREPTEDAQDTTAAGKGKATAEPTPGDESPADLKEQLDRLRKAQAETNRKAAADRKRLEEYEKAEKDREDAKLGETDRLRKLAEDAARKAREAEERLAAAESRIVQVQTDQEIERHAAALGFQYPDDVAKLIDRDLIEHDESGRATPKSVREAVERLAKLRPGLLDARRGGGTPPRESTRRVLDAPAAGQSRGRQIDPYEQDLLEMGRGGRM